MDVSGDVSGVWSKSNSPYIVTGNIRIPNGDTLIVEQGTGILFEDGKSMLIEGALIAQGTSSEHITFAPSNPSPSTGIWVGLFFYYCDAGSILEYCDISYGGNGYTWGGGSMGNQYGCVNLNHCDNNLTMRNCTISESQYDGIYMHSNSSPEIIDCTVRNNNRHGIYCSNSSDPILTDCTVIENGEYAIILYASAVSNLTGTFVVMDNGTNIINIRAENISSGTWHNIGVPYLITESNIQILDGETLTVEAGVEINFEDGRAMLISGALIAQGTGVDHIIFKSFNSSPTPGIWVGLFFYECDAGSILEYCDVSYGGSGYTWGGGSMGNQYGCVNINHCYDNLTVQNCNITNSQYDGIHLHRNSSPRIVDCSVNNNNRHGVYCSFNSSDPEIMNCSMSNNDEYPIGIFANTIPNITGTMTIVGNTNNAIKVMKESVETGTWHHHGVPYVVTEAYPLLVPDGEVLTIDPGVIIKFEGTFVSRMEIEGKLIAQGTSSEHITFTTSQSLPIPGSWCGLGFGECDAGTVLEYCDVQYAGSHVSAPLGGGSVYWDGNITIHNCENNLVISNCTFTNSLNDGIYVQKNSIPHFNNCTIENNARHGINCHALYCTADPIISSCNISYNGDYAINLDANTIPNIMGTMTISGNTNNAIKVIEEPIETGTWHDHGVPYVITEAYPLLVTDGEVLMIDPGVIMKFEGTFVSRMEVEGKLIARGTSSEHITFTTSQSVPTQGSWCGLGFGECDPGTVLEYCDVQYAGSHIWASLGDDNAYWDGNLTIHSSIVEILNCTFSHSQNDGIYFINSPVNVIDCCVHYNSRGGIRLEDSYGDIKDCLIDSNNTDGIYAQNADSLRVIGNLISNHTTGIKIENSQLTIKYNDLYNNTSYTVENLGTQNIDATQNYWGTATLAEMEAGSNPKNITKIFDHFDDVSKGTVDYDN